LADDPAATSRGGPSRAQVVDVDRDPDQTAGLPEDEQDELRRVDRDATGVPGTDETSEAEDRTDAAEDAGVPDHELDPQEGTDTGGQTLNP
jgi:hypothetical protein